MKRRALVVLALCAMAWLMEVGLARYFAEHDAIAALLVRRELGTALLLLSLLCLRLFTILVAPGLCLYWCIARSYPNRS